MTPSERHRCQFHLSAPLLLAFTLLAFSAPTTLVCLCPCCSHQLSRSPLPMGHTARLLLFLSESCPERGLLGCIPAFGGQRIYYTLSRWLEGFELVDGVNDTVDNSLRLKNENRKPGKLFRVSVKTGRWGKVSWFFQMPSLPTCQK